MAKLEKIEKSKSVAEEEEKTKVPAVPGRQNTISIAVPCSVIDNCQNLELKCYLASMVARSAAIFGIDEVIVYNDTNVSIPETLSGDYTQLGKHSHSAVTLASILQYMECPPYLRKSIFPHKTEFELASRMNPLNIPHHKQDHPLFREGIVSTNPSKPGKGSLIYYGVQREIQTDRLLEAGLRVTVKLEKTVEGQKKLNGKIVSPQTPRLENSIYWGYSVRLAKNFSEVFQKNPFKSQGKYDLVIGTSENGISVEDAELKSFQHCLVVFGGLQGLEAAMENDETLKASKPTELFDAYLNTCMDQGSRTIRTEEALFISLAALQSKLL